MVWPRGCAYSADLRERVLAATGTSRVVAARFGVSASYVIKARQRLDRAGEAGARKPSRTRLRRLAGHEEALRGHLREHIDATLAELRAWLSHERGVQIGITALWNEVARLGLTLKKVPPCGRAGQARPRGGTACLARSPGQPEPVADGVPR